MSKNVITLVTRLVPAVLAPAAPLLLVWATPPVVHAWRSLRRPDAAPERLVEHLVVVLCAAAMAAVLLWLLTCVAVCWADTRRGGTPVGAPDGLFRPRLVRALVAGAVGAAVATSAPGAGAARGPELPRTLDGLPLPDRTYGGVRTHVVTAGESLWSITSERLPAGADDPRVARAWPRLHRLNRDRIGPDPDLIRPGTTLRLPPWGSVPTRGVTP